MSKSYSFCCSPHLEAFKAALNKVAKPNDIGALDAKVKWYSNEANWKQFECTNKPIPPPSTKTKSLYYEAHITIEPLFDEKLERFTSLCKDYKFRVAELLMKKRKENTEERSKNDSFCTSQDKSFIELESRMFYLIKVLQKENFKIWRYKIESILLDSKIDDSEFPLG